MPGDDNGRPGQGGHHEAAENHSDIRVPDQVTRAILAALRNGDAVTLPELAARLEAVGFQVDGDESLTLGQDPHAVVWSSWRAEVVDAVVELAAAGDIVVERCSPYRYGGAWLDLPLVPPWRPTEPLREPAWFPAIVQRRGAA